MASGRALVLVLLSLLVLVVRPGVCLDCIIPTNWLTPCTTYLKTGDPQSLTTADSTPIFGTAPPTCCDKFVDLKQTYYELNNQADRQNMCACIRQECRHNKWYNYDRLQSIATQCSIQPISDTLVISRTSPCELLQ
ncbi:hypothetical protein Droror1_Dr00026458 [Drosera rotundifolia]